jgi:hypothetical protein
MAHEAAGGCQVTLPLQQCWQSLQHQLMAAAMPLQIKQEKSHSDISGRMRPLEVSQSNTVPATGIFWILRTGKPATFAVLSQVA